MIKKISIGVDPGSSGAMCVIIDYDTGRTEMHVHRFKKMTEKEIAECFKSYRDYPGKRMCFVYLRESIHFLVKECPVLLNLEKIMDSFKAYYILMAFLSL